MGRASLEAIIVGGAMTIRLEAVQRWPALTDYPTRACSGCRLPAAQAGVAGSSLTVSSLDCIIHGWILWQDTGPDSLWSLELCPLDPALHCTALYCTALHCTALRSTTRHDNENGVSHQVRASTKDDSRGSHGIHSDNGHGRLKGRPPALGD